MADHDNRNDNWHGSKRDDRDDQAALPFALRRLGLVMEPDRANPDESGGVLNPAAARGPDGALYLFPRVVAAGDYSRVGRARVIFDAAGDPAGVERLGEVLRPETAYEVNRETGVGGCEDPRVTFVEPLGAYVMAYVGHGETKERVALAISDDLRLWRRLGPVTYEPAPDPDYGVDFNSYADKDASLFPRTVVAPDGRESLALLHRPIYDAEHRPHGIPDGRHRIWISYRALDDVRRDPRALTRWSQQRVLIGPQYPWEDAWIGGGAPPLLTPLGWLIIYHGVQNRAPLYPGERKAVIYRAGALVTDVRDPCRVLYRSPAPILSPETADETGGVAPFAVFPTATDDRGDGRVEVYYGMADTRIGVATLRVPATLP